MSSNRHHTPRADKEKWTSIWVRRATKEAFRQEARRRGLVIQFAADAALQVQIKEWSREKN